MGTNVFAEDEVSFSQGVCGYDKIFLVDSTSGDAPADDSPILKSVRMQMIS